MENYDFSRLSVLVVDDNVHIRRLVRTILEAFGCGNISEAATAADALRILSQENIDIVILDWVMPEVDGLELTRVIRKGDDVPNPYIPIIMLTGLAERRRIIEARDAGVTEFLAKPVAPKSLMSRLKMIIEKPRPFVRTQVFFGPDRRRKDSSFYNGPERREEEKEKGDVFEIDDNAGGASAAKRNVA